MNRLAIRMLTLVLCLTTLGLDAGQQVLSIDVPEAAHWHAGEIEAKRASMERAMARDGEPLPKSWAPIPEPSPIDVIHYDLGLFLDLSRRVVSGTAVVEVAAVADGLTEIELRNADFIG